MRRLIEEFGEKRAREIMGDTRPVQRRKPVPEIVGAKERRLPALTRSGPTGNPGWRELRDLDELDGRPPNRVTGVRIATFRTAGRCTGCAGEIVIGAEAMQIERLASKRWYCVACGQREVERG
jgi:hypothetical protein